MACAACDHVQRIWINLLISWHRIEWQVPNVWISWKWEKWNQYHCSFHFGYLFGLDLAIGRPWYTAACKKMPCQTKRQGLNCRCLGYRCLVQRQYQKGSPALDWKSCWEGIWCNDFFAMWFLASWNDFVNIYEQQWWRERCRTIIIIQHIWSNMHYRYCKDPDDVMIVALKKRWNYDGISIRPAEADPERPWDSKWSHQSHLFWSSFEGWSEHLWSRGRSWRMKLGLGIYLERQVESFLWDIVDIRRNLLKKVSSEISLGGGDQT